MIKKLNKNQLQDVSGGHGSYCRFPDGKILVANFNIEGQFCEWVLFNSIAGASIRFPNIGGYTFRSFTSDPPERLASIREKIEQSIAQNGPTHNIYIQTDFS